MPKLSKELGEYQIALSHDMKHVEVFWSKHTFTFSKHEWDFFKRRQKGTLRLRHGCFMRHKNGTTIMVCQKYDGEIHMLFTFDRQELIDSIQIEQLLG